jgi:hypothetical protein
LKRLLQGITLAAAALAAYRYVYPHGIPSETIERAWREIARALQAAPFVVLVPLPTTVVVWSVLIWGQRKSAILIILAWVAGWDAAALWLGEFLGTHYGFPFSAQVMAAMQVGATAAAFVSAVVLRSCGYRLARAATSQEPAPARPIDAAR